MRTLQWKRNEVESEHVYSKKLILSYAAMVAVPVLLFGLTFAPLGNLIIKTPCREALAVISPACFSIHVDS